jgi:hypothetical protein
MSSAAALAHGDVTCNLSDGSQAGHWRLPLVGEWEAMVDWTYTFPALSNAEGTGQWTEGDAFSGVQSTYYWSSSSVANNSGNAWFVLLSNSGVGGVVKTHTYHVWPVRGGQ